MAREDMYYHAWQEAIAENEKLKTLLQKVVDQTERAEKKAFEAMNPIAMVLHPKSILVSEIREFLK